MSSLKDKLRLKAASAAGVAAAEIFKIAAETSLNMKERDKNVYEIKSSPQQDSASRSKE